ncbi:spindle and centriole-associated protein 1 isoform X2 [Clarias gariepinus]|uniref:spindle and centriole-associated protein 1 isoform X2 n=1 Tax=Clarias gariepinus TaxID=13013 RepID=UPI00234D668A|nr:spindle and centriole-associated protein 1 isoform X2 [Clarias gariepinus]
MSFVRINRRPVRTKKVSIPKREWVSTVNDLSVYKSTAEELSRRHALHRSCNRAAAQWELREKRVKNRKPRVPSPPGLDQTRLRLFREALNDDSALEHGQDVVQDVSVSFDRETSRQKRKTCKAKPSVWRTTQQPHQQNLPQTPSNAPSSEDRAALNATLAVQRLKLRQSPSETGETAALVSQVLNPELSPSHYGGKNKSTRGRSPETSQNSNQSSLELLQDMLAQVETELACLEPQELFGSSEQPELQHGRGLTGFSVALIGTLGRIVSHLRRRDEEAQKEAQVRRRMEDVMMEQRSLIDALTAECLALREESASLKVSLQERISELEQRLDMVILAMGELGKDGDAQNKEGNAQSRDIQPVTAERDQEEPAILSPAVLLSPPHQRDSRAPPTGRGRSLHFEDSHTPGSGSATESDDSCTPSSFASLPESILPRPTPMLDQLSQDAVLEQIVELTRQNAEIRAQLGHSNTSPTPSTERRVSPSAVPQFKQKCVGVDNSSVRLMEDRLQELNRQSAAARAKLLELIEQQRQTTSQNASPSISPIPPHSTIPHTVIGRPTAEVCVPIPERDQPSHTRQSARAFSPQNVEGTQKQIVTTQVDKPKGGGWFALSSHVR